MAQIRKAANSYGQILKSTTIIGGSSIIQIIIRVIQAKFLAILLGPAGVGLIGIYNSIIELLEKFSGMGIRSSGVRQIAEALGTNDETKIATIIVTLRRIVFFLGIIGILILFFFRSSISQISFGDTSHSSTLGIISVIIFMLSISNGQTAVIQGMRRIGDLAKFNILSRLLGLVFGIPFVYFLGERGIAPFLIVGAISVLLSSWWYAKNVSFQNIYVSWKDMIVEAKSLLQLGLAFMFSGLISLGTMYFIRVVIIRELGIDEAGYFQAANSLSSIYVGFILSAMSADFYPRLTSVSNDNIVCNRMVNEQAEISLLLATPGIIATLTFAPYVISIFYSAQFTPAIDILRWTILGIFLRVACWPMCFILLAKGKGKIFLFTEFSSHAVYLALVFFLIRWTGLQGIGIAFFGLYIFHWILIFSVVKKISGFSFSKANTKLYSFTIPILFLVFLSAYFLSNFWATLIGTSSTLIIGIYCLLSIKNTIGSDKFNEILIKLNLNIPHSKR